MRIGFNAQIVTTGRAGIAVSARNLIQHLVQLESPHTFVVFGGTEFLSTLQSPNVECVISSMRMSGSWQRILWEQCVLPFQMRRYGIDVMLFDDHTLPLASSACKQIITIHDLAFLAHPETFPASTRVYKELAVKWSVRRAERIIVDSRATKIECERLLHIQEEKLRVVHKGLDETFTRIDDSLLLQQVCERYSLNSEFFLYVGTLEPRKNLVSLISAYDLLKRSTSIAHDLVIVGGKGWLFKDLFRQVKDLGLDNSVKFLGHVPQSDLVPLYNLASVFVYPSIYEGFGFPPLEAMACGCPVVTSNRSSIPEVVGDAAMLVDCLNVEALSKGLFDAVVDEKLRGRLKKTGLDTRRSSVGRILL